MPKNVLHCLCWSCLRPVASGWSVAVWCHLQRPYRYANCLTHCVLCSQAQLKLKQAQSCSKSAMCQMAGMLLQAAIWYPGGCQACQSWDSRGTHAAARGKRVPALQATSVSSGAWGVGCWASYGWDSIPACNMSSACGWLLRLFVSQVSSTACCQGLAWSAGTTWRHQRKQHLVYI